MSTVDIIIIIIFLLGIILGFKRGAVLEIVDTLGFVIALILAYFLKNNLSILMYENLPFFNLDFIFKGISVVNILIYELIAFLLVLVLTLILVKLLKIISKLVEKIFKATIILSIPSKILGGIIGGIKWVIITMIAAYILAFFNYKIINNSVICNFLMDNNIFSEDIGKAIDTYREISNLKEKYSSEEDYNTLNKESLELLLDKKVITIDSVKVLKEKKKLKFKGLNEVIKKYEEEENGTN